MLDNCAIVAFVATTQPDRARAFYGDILGLTLIEESGYALVFDANGTMLRVQRVRELTPAKFTALGWQTPDILSTVTDLVARGVIFERVEGIPQDGQGIWTTPPGDKVAWFKDPDGNILSLTQFHTD